MVGRLHTHPSQHCLFALVMLSRNIFAILLSLSSTSMAVSGCGSVPVIPGTEIPDKPEFRQLVDVIERYRRGFVQKDAAAVLATAHVTYFDEAGTEDPSDDLTYTELGPMLRRRIDQLDSVRFTIEYLEATVQGDRGSVRTWVDASFRLKPFVDIDGKPRPQPPYTRMQDFAEFELLREGEGWLITKGL